MSRRSITLLLPSLLALLLLSCGVPEREAPPPVMPENVHGLILKSEFDARYAGDVETHWQRRVEDGFDGTGALRLRYVALVRPGAKAAVVISNGRTESFVKYKELAYDLDRAGYSVYIHDHRGQGMSPRVLTNERDHDKGYVEHFKDYVEDLQAFVEQVVAKGQEKQRFLLAHSMGGGIAVRYLQEHPGFFQAAALSSPMLEPNAKIFLSVESSCAWFRMTSWLCPSCYAGFTAKPYDPPASAPNEYTHSDERWQAVLKEYSANKDAQLGAPTRRWAAEACAVPARMLEDAGKVQIPVLLLQAGGDTAVVNSAQDAFYAALPKPGRQCHGRDGGPVKIPGAMHELFIEDDPYRVTALNEVLAFFGHQLGRE